MYSSNWKQELIPIDDRRDLAIPGDTQQTLDFCVEHFVSICDETIQRQGYFSVAFSGGKTPKALFEILSQPPYKDRIDWKRMLAFWSDERTVPPNHPESNYNMAMASGLSKVPLPTTNIFRMEGQGDIEQNAKDYNDLILQKIPSKKFDLVMLGMGEDGHTASLFPKTHALHSQGRVAVANYIPQKSCWRLTLTYECINAASNIVVYILGKQKAEIVDLVLSSDYDPDRYPIQKVGTPTHKALWILDEEAASIIEEGSTEN